MTRGGAESFWGDSWSFMSEKPERTMVVRSGFLIMRKLLQRKPFAWHPVLIYLSTLGALKTPAPR